MSIRVMLGDDHRIFIEALAGILSDELDIVVVSCVGSAAEIFAEIGRVRPDVLILDVGLPDENGIEVMQRLRREHAGARVLALSGYADRTFVEEMLKAGASGYVVKTASTQELINGVRAVAEGKHFLCAEATARMLNRFLPRADSCPPVSLLSQREREVLVLLANGKRAAEMAAEMGITVSTVEVHRRHLKDKLGLRTSADLTRYAIREGLVAP